MLNFCSVFPEDFEELTRIMTAAFDEDTQIHTDLQHDGPRGYDDGSLIKRFFENPDFQCQKVLLGQTIVGGYILSFQKDCGMLELLFVDPQFGGQGFETQIWKHIEQNFPEIRCWTLETPAYSVRNHRFYTQKCVFHFLKESFSPDGNSSYFFQKESIFPSLSK